MFTSSIINGKGKITLVVIGIQQIIAVGGNFVVKIFMGSQLDNYKTYLRSLFSSVHSAKPKFVDLFFEPKSLGRVDQNLKRCILYAEVFWVCGISGRMSKLREVFTRKKGGYSAYNLPHNKLITSFIKH